MTTHNKEQIRIRQVTKDLQAGGPLICKHEMLNCLQTFHPTSDVFEIRVIKAHNQQGKHLGTLSGYFDSPKKATTAIASANVGGNVYHTLNPLRYDCLARNINKLSAWARTTTQDSDVKYIRWLPIDIDPIRQTGLSATYEELMLANEVKEQVQEHLIDKYEGFDHSAISGNGCYVMVRVPGDKLDIKGFLAELADKFNTDHVEIDISIYNPARIMKVYGSLAQKGEHTPLYPNWVSSHRPWRYSYMIERGEQYNGI